MQANLLAQSSRLEQHQRKRVLQQPKQSNHSFRKYPDGKNMTYETKVKTEGVAFYSFLITTGIILYFTNIGEPQMEQTQTQIQTQPAHEVCFFHEFKREQIAEGVFITGRLPVDVTFDVSGNEVLINEITLNRADGVVIEGRIESYVIDLGVTFQKDNVYQDAKRYIEDNIVPYLNN